MATLFALDFGRFDLQSPFAIGTEIGVVDLHFYNSRTFQIRDGTHSQRHISFPFHLRDLGLSGCSRFSRKPQSSVVKGIECWKRYPFPSLTFFLVGKYSRIPTEPSDRGDVEIVNAPSSFVARIRTRGGTAETLGDFNEFTLAPHIDEEQRLILQPTCLIALPLFLVQGKDGQSILAARRPTILDQLLRIGCAST